MKSSSTRRDVRQEVTDAVIARIEAGGVPPWKCAYVKSDEKAMPHNYLTGESYSGINVLLLWADTIERNFSSNAWLTFKQATSIGASVRKREEVGPGVRCYFYKRIEVADKSAKDGKKYIPFLSPFTLFNVDQLVGLPEVERMETGSSKGSEAMLEVADRFCLNTGVTLEWGGNQPSYHIVEDRIRMPKTFTRPDAMAKTLAHELIHSTGHSDRLDRFKENDQAMPDQQRSYAFEELIAEMGAAFTCAELCIDSERDATVSYIDSWLDAFNRDKSYLFKAVTAASKAQQYLLAGGGVQRNAEEQNDVA